MEHSYRKVLETIRRRVHFDAIVSIGGLVTYGAGKEILESKKRIPEELIRKLWKGGL
jgi:Tat protein secretion system quality control protein TatD with DNase activity